MTCATVDCQRTARAAGYTKCDAHFRQTMTTAFGARPVEQRAVERLSATDPFCVAVAEAKRGVRA
jgi:hypothetical protein